MNPILYIILMVVVIGLFIVVILLRETVLELTAIRKFLESFYLEHNNEPHN